MPFSISSALPIMPCKGVFSSWETLAVNSRRFCSAAVEGSPANVYGVKRLLYEIVYNLCDNAIKYNRQGGSVKISTVSEGDFSSVTVSDTGIGIAPEYQNRIFERFFRVDKSHSKSSGGTGLGLSIVKHAVQYHHGKIELTSAPGNGTSITVSFPAIQ